MLEEITGKLNEIIDRLPPDEERTSDQADTYLLVEEITEILAKQYA
jgi:hypothetical protein